MVRESWDRGGCTRYYNPLCVFAMRYMYVRGYSLRLVCSAWVISWRHPLGGDGGTVFVDFLQHLGLAHRYVRDPGMRTNGIGFRLLRIK